MAAAAGLEASEWTPRELRHSFVSLLSSSGVPIEDIAHLVGHASTSVTEKVHRKELRPVLSLERQPWMPCLVAVELVGQTSSLTSYFDPKKSRRVDRSNCVLTRENGPKPLARRDWDHSCFGAHVS